MTNKEYGKIIAKNLKRILYDSGRKQVDVAKDLNIPKTTVSGWVNGTRVPRMDHIDMLCHYFNVRRSDIMDNANGYYEKNSNPAKSNDITTMFNALNSSGQAMALEYMRFLLSNDQYKKISSGFVS